MMQNHFQNYFFPAFSYGRIFEKASIPLIPEPQNRNEAENSSILEIKESEFVSIALFLR